MYIDSPRSGYLSDGTQVVRRGLFLMLVEPEDRLVDFYEIRAIVRKVALRQLGHFMVGCARVKGKTLAISGSYGYDGLPMRVPEQVYQEAIPVPRKLMDAWNNGGGWNGCGSEASQMRQWAIDNLRRLYRVKS